MNWAPARREAIAAGLFGMAIAGFVWGPALVRPFTFTEAVDLRTLHLSEDQASPRGRAASPAAKITTLRPASRIDINHAEASALQTLPGIGPALAQRIVAYRKTYGSFADTRGLLEVDGIGPKRLGKIEPWIEAR